MIFIFLLFPLVLAAQKNLPIKIMGIPQEYIVPEYNADRSNVLSINTGAYWEVFSDRSNNNLFRTSEAKEIGSKASLNDTYFVNNMVGEYLHVYSDPSPDLNNFYLGKTAVDKGWINMHDLLLWRHCLIDGKTKQNIQAMTFGQEDMYNTQENSGNSKTGVEVYNDPELLQKRKIYTEARQLYFVYKIEPKAILLGRERKIPFGTDPMEIIIGWVPIDFCYLPQSRTWIMPNDSPEALSEMSSKNIAPSIFFDQEQAIRFRKTSKADKKFVIWNYQPESDKNDWIYFPLIKEQDGIEKIKMVDDDFKTAYAPWKPDSMQYPLFKYVTLMSNQELMEVVLNMRSVIDNSSTVLDRQKLKLTLILLMKKEYPNLEEEKILNYKLKEIFENLFWITNSSEAVLNNSVRKLTDESLIPDSFLIPFLAKMRTSLDELSRLSTGKNSKLTFVSNSTRYYWVDLRFFY